jgi:hypothetical protein
MPQPYDYTPGQPPNQAFMQGLEFSQGLRQQQAQASRAQQMQQALQALRGRATPEAFAEFYLQFPEMREQIEAYRTTLADADKSTLLSATREALTLRRAGRGDEVGALFDSYAEAANNSNRPDLARQFEDAKRVYDIDPDETGDFALRMQFESLDPDGYKQFFGNESATTFEKDFAFIAETFGEDAAAEFAQFGRGGVVSIPLGNGQTYVGPASMAPGASRWQARGAEPQEVESAPEILQRASQAKTITAAEARVIQRSLGPNGRTKFQEWLRDNDIKVIVRTGTAADGRRVVQFEDGTVAYAD